MAEKGVNWLKVVASLMLVGGIFVGILTQSGVAGGVAALGFVLFVVSRFMD